MKKAKLAVAISFLIPMVLLSFQVRAEEAPAVAATSGQSSFRASEALRNIGVSADSRLYGTSVADPFNSLKRNKDGILDARYPIHTENKLNVSYRLDGSYTTGATLWSTWEPVRAHNFKWLDPSLFIRKSDLIRSGNYQMSGGFRLMMGLSEGSKKYGTLAGLRFESTQSYRIPDSRASVGFYMFAQPNILKADAKAGSWDAQFLFIPSAEYKILPNLTAQLSYKQWTHHEKGQSLSNLTSERILAGPGLLWQPLPAFSLNPYVDFAPFDRVMLTTTNWGLYASWRML